MSIFRVSGKYIPDPDVPTQQPDKPRAIRVIKPGMAVNTRRDAPDRPLSVSKVADVFRKSNIDRIRENLLGGSVVRYRAQREAEDLRKLAILAGEVS